MELRFLSFILSLMVVIPTYSVAPTEVKISPSSKTIDVGKSVTLMAELTPSYATTTFTWGLAMYGEPYNFELTPSGSKAVLKANGAGSAYVVVETANGLQYVAIITAVSREATSVYLNHSSLYLQEDDIFQLTAEINPKNTTSKLTWSSSDTNVAKVSATGMVTAVATGNATITAKMSNGLTATCDITVTSEVLLYDYSTSSPYTATVITCRESQIMDGTITIPTSRLYNGKTYKVTEIDDKALNNINSLTTLVISEGVTKIGNSAFEYCNYLKNVVFPNSITEVGDYAFKSCSSISNPILNNKLFVYMSYSYKNSVYEIPEGITTICHNAFSDNESIKNIIIPSTVTHLADRAFNSSNINVVVCKALNPPYYYDYRSFSSGYTGTYVECFGDTQYNGTLYVPSEAKSDYLTNNRWKRFVSIRDISEYIPPKATITVSSLISSEGYTTGGGTYNIGETVKIEAFPYEGYEFSKWFDFGSSDDLTANPRYITITEDKTIYALFNKIGSTDYTPTNLRTTIDGIKVIFNWDAVSGASKYELDILYNNSSILTSTHITPNTTANIDFDDLDTGTYTFKWKVRTLDSNGNAISDWASKSFTITIKKDNALSFEDYEPNYAELWYDGYNKDVRLYIMDDNYENVLEVLNIRITTSDYRRISGTYRSGDIAIDNTYYWNNNSKLSAIIAAPAPYLELEYVGKTTKNRTIYNVNAIIALSDRTVKMVVDKQLIIYAFKLTDTENDTWVEYTLEDEPTSIENITYDQLKLNPNLPMYNVLGMPVNIHYKGVVIQNGKKFYLW